MVQVGVVVHTSSGTTGLAAEAVARGVEQQDGAESVIATIRPDEFSAGRWSNDEVLRILDRCDAIVFGCPTYMGGVSAQLKAFFDATLDRYASGAWRNKIAGGFTVSSTPSGDKLQTLISMATYAMQMGMIWVGVDQLPINDEGINRLSYYFGAGVQADYTAEQPAIDARDEHTAVLLGTRIAGVALQMAR